MWHLWFRICSVWGLVFEGFGSSRGSGLAMQGIGFRVFGFMVQDLRGIIDVPLTLGVVPTVLVRYLCFLVRV